MVQKTSIGRVGEDQALQWFLTHRQNASLVRRNFYSKTGEIDLIFEEQLNSINQVELVFVEVRFCSSRNWLMGPETLSDRKQQRLSRTARVFLATYGGRAQSVRFDLLYSDGHEWYHIPNIWLRNHEAY